MGQSGPAVPATTIGQMQSTGRLRDSGLNPQDHRRDPSRNGLRSAVRLDRAPEQRQLVAILRHTGGDQFPTGHRVVRTIAIGPLATGVVIAWDKIQPVPVGLSDRGHGPSEYDHL